MALVRLLHDGTVTLPADFRQKLKLAEGDYLEVEMVEDGVLLKPASALEREQAWDELMQIIEEPKRRGPTTMTPEEGEEFAHRGNQGGTYGRACQGSSLTRPS